LLAKPLNEPLLQLDLAMSVGSGGDNVRTRIASTSGLDAELAAEEFFERNDSALPLTNRVIALDVADDNEFDVTNGRAGERLKPRCGELVQYMSLCERVREGTHNFGARQVFPVVTERLSESSEQLALLTR
jgi:hypothetical protein